MKRTITRNYVLAPLEVQEALVNYLKFLDVPYPNKIENLKFSLSIEKEGFLQFEEIINTSTDKELNHET